MDLPHIIIAEQDLNRLQALLEHQTQETQTTIHLDNELARAEVIEPALIAADIVTMNSSVRLTINGEKKELTLVYPHDFNDHKNQVSVLAPVGAAILGLSEKQSIEWPQPNGKMMLVSIDQVVFQPEKTGNFI